MSTEVSKQYPPMGRQSGARSGQAGLQARADRAERFGMAEAGLEGGGEQVVLDGLGAESAGGGEGSEGERRAVELVTADSLRSGGNGVGFAGEHRRGVTLVRQA